MRKKGGLVIVGQVGYNRGTRREGLRRVSVPLPHHFFENNKELLRKCVFKPPSLSHLSAPTPHPPPPHFQSSSAVPDNTKRVECDE